MTPDPLPPPQTETEDTVLSVTVHESMVVISIQQGGHCRHVPLSPMDARALASYLVMKARAADPNGHNGLIEAMKRDIGERVLFEALPAPRVTH